MRPVRLRFSGLRSYRSETLVDFSSLDLFAVIGDTGAGKSTLIEALCLALYGKRSWTGGTTRMEDLITDGVNTMRIELTFVADGHEWTVTRARHRNASSPIDKLVSASGGPGADGAAPVTQRVTELIGLNYDQFTRAVVLPQGRFDSLLRATEKERNEILTSILDLGDVAATKARAEALRREWEPKVIAWTTERDRYPTDPKAAVDAAAAAAAAAAERDERFGVAVDHIATLAERTATSTLERTALRSALDAVPDLPAEPAAQLTAAAARWGELDELAELAATERSTALEEASELADRATALLRGAESRDQLVGASRDVHSVVTDLPDAVAEVEAAMAARDDIGERPPAIEPAVALVDEAAKADADLASCEADRRVADDAVQAASHAWRAVVAARSDLVAKRAAVDTYDERLATGHVVVAESEVASADADAVLEAAVAAEHIALRADAAATAAAGCGAGDECPVCARPLPDAFAPPAPAVAVAAARAQREQAAARARELAERLVAHRSQLAKLDGERSSAELQAEAAAIALDEALERATSFGVNVDAGSETDALAATTTAAAIAAEAVDRARARQTDASAALQRERADLQAAAAAHTRDVAAASERCASAERRLERLHARLVDLPGEWSVPPGATGDPRIDVSGAEALAAALDAAVEQLRQVDVDRARVDAVVRQVEDRLADVARRVNDEVRRPVAALLGDLDAHATALGRLAVEDTAPSGFVVPDDRASLVELAASVDRWVAAGSANVAVAATRLAELDALVADSEAEIAGVVAGLGCTSAAELQERRGEARRDRSAAESEYAVARESAATAAALDERLDVAAPFVANLAVLEVALRSQHFVAHLVDARERELLAEASRRLKGITGGRFGFVSDFGIVDVRSGEVRSPDTLSGGERFQAALALALALVEIASRGAGKLDAVFVDEGFGSLDQHALDVALTTLGSVAGGGKMVALISHLRPVAEFVDDVFMVTKDDMSGSRIELLDADARDDMLADDVRSGLTG